MLTAKEEEAVKVYTYQIGDGDGKTIVALSHSETLGANDLPEAIAKAKTITNSRAPRATENTVRLLEELDADSRVMWVRPIEAVRNTDRT